MNLIQIIILVIILISLILITALLCFSLKKQKQTALNSLIKDLNIVNDKYKIKTLNLKHLPLNLEDIDTLNKDIYFCNKAVIGLYEYPHKVINDKNINISKSIKNSRLEIFYHYYILKLTHQKFIPLNKTDLLITKTDVYLHHPLEPENISLSKINKLTFFWEKNPLVRKKGYFPAVSFNYEDKHYFLLFQTYNEALKFIVCVNNIHE